jgi:hypothetical protein
MDHLRVGRLSEVVPVGRMEPVPLRPAPAQRALTLPTVLIEVLRPR